MKDVIYENYTQFLILDNPNLFLEIPKEILSIVDLIFNVTNISQKKIFLTLKKLKFDLPNIALAYEFGVAQVGRIIRKTAKKTN